jgi:hypothetical protein
MTRLATPAAVRAPNQRSRSFARPSRASRASRRARRATGRARGAREDDDFDDFKADATSRDDDDGARVERRVELSAAQAKIAAVALETLYGATRADEDAATTARDDARRGRLEMILREAVERAKASCEEEGTASASCVTAWEEVAEVRDAASRAGVRTRGEGEDLDLNARGKTTKAEEAAKRAKAKEMRERLAKDPLMGSLPCRGLGECTVAEGTLEARGRLMAREEDGDAATSGEADPSAARRSAVEAAVARAIELCASGATREACAIAWEEVEELTSWGGGRREGD